MSQHIPLAVVVILLSMLPSTAEIGIKNSWLYFDSNSSSKENVSVAFQLERHVISNGEKWEGVISKGDGIDVMAVDRTGNTALQFAESFGNAECATLIKAFIADPAAFGN